MCEYSGVDIWHPLEEAMNKQKEVTMTYREYKPTWLEQKIFVDTYGREYNLSDVPMTYMTRKVAFEKRGYSQDKIDELYKEAAKKQKEFNNG